LEDAYRIGANWDVQVSFLTSDHNALVFNHSVALAFLGFSFLSELICGALIVFGKAINFAASTLLVYMSLLVIVYGFGLPEWVHFQGRVRFLIRSMALAGGLMMLVADQQLRQKEQAKQHYFAGVPTVDMNKFANLLQLFGRMSMAGLCLQFWTHDHASWYQMVVLGTISTIAAVLVVVGYKARYGSLLLATFLTVTHIMINNFWDKHPSHADAMQYFFFQDVSILGGLILLITLGPGGLSVDEKKAL